MGTCRCVFLLLRQLSARSCFTEPRGYAAPRCIRRCSHNAVTMQVAKLLVLTGASVNRRAADDMRVRALVVPAANHTCRETKLNQFLSSHLCGLTLTLVARLFSGHATVCCGVQRTPRHVSISSGVWCRSELRMSPHVSRRVLATSCVARRKCEMGDSICSLTRTFRSQSRRRCGTLARHPSALHER